MTGEPIPNPAGLHLPITVVPPKPRGSGRVWYRPNRRSFGAFIRSDQVRDPVAEVAEDIASMATASRPGPSRDTDPERVAVTYTVKREAGLVKVAGNLRVSVEVEGRGEGAERAEFGNRGAKRYRTLGTAGAHFGDMHHSEDVT